MNKYCWLAIALIVCLGCDSKETANQTTAPERPDLLIVDEPADLMTPTNVKETLSQPTTVSLVGRVDAGEMDPFDPNQASFMVSEMPDAAHAGGDPNHVDNCPFCKRKLAKAPKAIVRIVDDKGDVLQRSAPALLGLSNGDVVVVRGTASYSETLNAVEVTADGVHIRR